MDQPKQPPCELQEVPVPKSLIESLTEVVEMIEDEAWATTAPTDDCIQVGCLCGGLDEDMKTFNFTVYLKNPDQKWHLSLRQFEILSIVSGKHKTLDLWCCANSDCGYKSDHAFGSCDQCSRAQNSGFAF
jgi:hypothetical protein